MKKISFIAILLIGSFIFSQDNKTAPIFPGCEPSKKSTESEREEEDVRCLNECIAKHIKRNFEYPRKAKKKGIQEKIYVKFVIDKTGSITGVSVARGKNPLLKEAAIRLIKSLPKMKPATQGGKPVSVNYTIPINYSLN